MLRRPRTLHSEVAFVEVAAPREGQLAHPRGTAAEAALRLPRGRWLLGGLGAAAMAAAAAAASALRRRRWSGAVSAGAQSRGTAAAAALRLSKGRCPRSLLGGLGAAALAVAAASALVPMPGLRDECAAAKSQGSVVLRGSWYTITLDRSWDPSGVGRVVVAPCGGSAPTSESFAEFLDAAWSLTSRKTELEGGFVAILDSREMVWPSMLSIPRILSVLSFRPPPTELREKTRAIAIVQGDGGRVLGMVVNLVVALVKPVLVPMFAASREAAEELCAQQLALPAA